ncbi:MAG TPA: hypothetical protein VL241_04970 [Gemmatimonadales bacterium]|nr:hypothetical protein [Gemmatimonadales bacterium]
MRLMRMNLRMAGLGLAALVGAQALAAQAPTVTVGGVAYAQFAYQLKDTANHSNNFDVTRAYLNVLGKFAYGINTRVTADVYRNTDGSLAYRLKYAFASWTPNDGKSPLTFKLGQIHTPWIDWEEHLWDYRMQGQMATERAGFMSSSDFGAGIDGMWGYDRFNFQVGVYNGENYNKAPGDQRKDLMGRASLRVLASDEGGRDGGLRLSGYAQLGKPTGGGTRQRFIGMLSYRSKLLTLAGEFAATKDSVLSAPVTPRKDAQLVSLFGVLRVPKTKLQMIARLDSFDPDTDAGNDRTNRFIAGVAYQLSGNLRVLADIDHVDRTTPALEAFRSQALLQVQFTF